MIILNQTQAASQLTKALKIAKEVTFSLLHPHLYNDLNKNKFSLNNFTTKHIWKFYNLSLDIK